MSPRTRSKDPAAKVALFMKTSALRWDGGWQEMLQIRFLPPGNLIRPTRHWRRSSSFGRLPTVPRSIRMNRGRIYLGKMRNCLSDYLQAFRLRGLFLLSGDIAHRPA